MKRYIESIFRHQWTLFPDHLEDWIKDENVVGVIDAFVDELDLVGLGFDLTETTGRPGYHPSILLKLYIYGGGSKFKAINNRDRNVTKAKMQRRKDQIAKSVTRYLDQFDSTDRREPSPAKDARKTRLNEKITRLREEMPHLKALEKQMEALSDQQISLTDPDPRPMATSGRGSGVVGYNVQTAVDTEHHLIVAHEVTDKGSDRSQLAVMAKKAKEVLDVDELDVVADRGYFNSTGILACDQAGITVTLLKPSTSTAKAAGRFGKQDFRYVADAR
jgi:hypothetical protein